MVLLSSNENIFISISLGNVERCHLHNFLVTLVFIVEIMLVYFYYNSTLMSLILNPIVRVHINSS